MYLRSVDICVKICAAYAEGGLEVISRVVASSDLVTNVDCMFMNGLRNLRIV